MKKKRKMRKVYYNQEYGEFKKIDKLGEVEETMSDFIPFEERLEELEKAQQVQVFLICQGGIEGETQKNNQKTQKSVDKDYKRVYNIIIKKLSKALLVDL